MTSVAPPTSPVPVLSYEAGEVDRRFRYWRQRILLSTIVGYALYYFVRSNISVPLKAIGADLNYTREQLGIITTIGGVTYGVSKFINGFLGDHANPRYFMAIGLVGAAIMNVCFGLSSTILFFASFWFFNNWFQGMGFPPCAKSMAHWFTPRERASVFGVWHSSHMIGAALVGVLTGYLVKHLGWRSCFYIPAGLAVCGAVYVLIFLRDTPSSMGLPPVEIYKGEETPSQLAEELKPRESYWQIVVQYIFKNPYMWVISFANLSVYVLRYAQMTWGPTFLQEYKELSVVTSGWLYFGAEMGGLAGALVAGFVTDRVFNGRAGRVCVIAMALMSAAVWAFWKLPVQYAVVAGVLYVVMGFLLYIPQMLIAAMAMNLGTKRASAAAVGLTGIIGYASTIITGWGIGSLVDRGLVIGGHQWLDKGWPSAFKVMLLCASITLVLMAITWNVGAHPELKDKAEAK
jgi:sugar phosphate permease